MLKKAILLFCLISLILVYVINAPNIKQTEIYSAIGSPSDLVMEIKAWKNERDSTIRLQTILNRIPSYPEARVSALKVKTTFFDLILFKQRIELTIVYKNDLTLTTELLFAKDGSYHIVFATAVIE